MSNKKRIDLCRTSPVKILLLSLQYFLVEQSGGLRSKLIIHWWKMISLHLDKYFHEECFKEKEAFFSSYLFTLLLSHSLLQKQPPRGVLWKRCSENMQQIYRLLCNFIEITLRHGGSPVNLLHISWRSFLENTSGWLLLLTLAFYLERFSKITWRYGRLLNLRTPSSGRLLTVF